MSFNSKLAAFAAKLLSTNGGKFLSLDTNGDVAVASTGYPAGSMTMWPTSFCPSWAVVRDGSALSRTTYPNLYAAIVPTVTGTITTGQNTVTGLTSTIDMYVGMPVEGTGIQAGTTVASITGLTSVTLSANATGTGAIPIRIFLYGYGTSGSATTFGVPDDRGVFERGLDQNTRQYEKTLLAGTTTISNTSVTGLSTTKGMFIGMPVFGVNIAAATTIASINSSTSITLSANATATSSTYWIGFTGGQIGNERLDNFQGHGHSGIGNTSKPYTSGGVSGDFLTASDIAPLTNTTIGIGQPVADYLQGSATFGLPRNGAETRPRYRNYLPIIAT